MYSGWNAVTQCTEYLAGLGGGLSSYKPLVVLDLGGNYLDSGHLFKSPAGSNIKSSGFHFVFKNTFQKVGQDTDKHVGPDSSVLEMANWNQLLQALEGSERTLDHLKIPVRMDYLIAVHVHSAGHKHVLAIVTPVIADPGTVDTELAVF